MKLYTRPRPIAAYLLRPLDHIAISKRKPGQLIQSEVSFIDADLATQVVWSVVHAAFEAPEETPGTMPVWRIQHTLGQNDVKPGSLLIVREAIEIDPWSYIKAPATA